jgi:hypothetical protein
MPRTTIDLDPAVLRELKARGAAQRRSLGSVASELLAVALREPGEGSPPARPFAWSTVAAGRPLVDLDDTEAVRRALERS